MFFSKVQTGDRKKSNYFSRKQQVLNPIKLFTKLNFSFF